MPLLLPCTFVLNSLPRCFWESLRVLLVVKSLEDIWWALLWAKNAFLVEFHGFCLSIVYIARPHHPYIGSLPTLWWCILAKVITVLKLSITGKSFDLTYLWGWEFFGVHKIGENFLFTLFILLACTSCKCIIHAWHAYTTWGMLCLSQFICSLLHVILNFNVSLAFCIFL